MRWAGGALFSGALLLLSATQALGEQPQYAECTRKPTDSDIEGAKGAHKAATQFFERADYDRAIQYWRDAYNFDCTKPALLLNIANAYEKKGDREAAVLTLEAYLRFAPGAPDAKTIAEKVANLRALMRPAATSTTGPGPTPSASEDAGAPPPPPPDAGSGGGDGPGLAPWIVVGVGGVVAIGGGVLLPIGLGKVSDAEAACPVRSECKDQAVVDDGNSGRTQALLGGVALGVGVAAVAGGLVWAFVLDDSGESAKSMSVTPVAGPEGGGVVTTLHF